MTRATFRNDDDARKAFWRMLHWSKLYVGRLIVSLDGSTVTVRDEFASADALREFAQIVDAIGGAQS